MLLVLAIPIFLAVTAAHRCLQIYAPSNRVIRQVRSAVPRWRTAAGLLLTTAVFVIAARALEYVIDAGAPSWLNLVLLILAWDAVKFGCLTVLVAVRSVVYSVGAAISRVRSSWS